MDLNKNEKVKIVQKMLSALSEEEMYGGFNEYPQFCEEALETLIPLLPHKALDYLMDEIEANSHRGISRKDFC